MRYLLSAFFLWIGFSVSKAQTTATLTLEECVQFAKLNYPLIKEKDLLRQTESVNIRGLNKNWLPKLTLASQATYQSEVTSLPGYPIVFPKDQYQNALQMEQALFDGGITSQQKEIEHLNAQSETEKNEIELYKVVDRITQLYCNVLMARENLKILQLYKDDIGNKKGIIVVSLQNGLVLESNLNALEAEELKTEQNIIELNGNINGFYSAMTILMNQPVNDSVKFTTQTLTAASEIARPELRYFSSQMELLRARYKLTNKGALPKLAFFGEAIYGRPGYNFLDQSLRMYGKVGLSLRWNISSLYFLNKEKQNFDININRVDVQKQLFDMNVKTALSSQEIQIKSLKEIIEKDNRIIEKRIQITQTASKQLENGSMTSTDYLTELNAEMQARLNMKVHEIKLMNAVSNYAAIKGVNNF